MAADEAHDALRVPRESGHLQEDRDADFTDDFSHLGDVGLTKEGGSFRVEAEGEIIEGDVARVVGQDLRIVDGGEGVVVGDEVEALGFVL